MVQKARCGRAGHLSSCGNSPSPDHGVKTAPAVGTAPDSPGVVLAIDPGDVRVGLAISDATGTFAFPLEVVEADRAVARIQELIAERSINRIVVGFPITLRGEVGPQGAHVRKFIERLRRAVRPIPVAALDERLSSKEADGILGDRSGRGRDKRDAVAASLILERYLRTR